MWPCTPGVGPGMHMHVGVELTVCGSMRVRVVGLSSCLGAWGLCTCVSMWPPGTGVPVCVHMWSGWLQAQALASVSTGPGLLQ